MLTQFSCKDNPSTTEEATTEMKGGNIIHTVPQIVSPENRLLIDKNRNHAFHLIDSRSKKETTEPFLTDGYWIYEGVFDGGTEPQAVEEGYYIKFEDNFSYYYGFKKEVHGGGRYHMTSQTADQPILILLDNHEMKMPEEWKVKSSDGFVVFIGSDYFGNNPRQMKLYNTPTSPGRS